MATILSQLQGQRTRTVSDQGSLAVDAMRSYVASIAREIRPHLLAAIHAALEQGDTAAASDRLWQHHLELAA